jgi:hypothetical protein
MDICFPDTSHDVGGRNIGVFESAMIETCCLCAGRQPTGMKNSKLEVK